MKSSSMLVNKAMQFVVLTAAIFWESKTEAATRTSVKLCGRQLSEIMSRVCHAYNSPSWDVPTVVEQPGAAVRRKRQLGIADECCDIGCTWAQLSEYCSINAYSESPLEELEAHMISDRSAEQEGGMVSGKRAALAGDRTEQLDVKGGRLETKGGSVEAKGGRLEMKGGHREVGSRGHGRARGRRCWCRRKRRSGRRRSSLMGKTNLTKNAVRPAPVVGTVSPLLTWGRTLNTDLPMVEPDRYAYIVYG